LAKTVVYSSCSVLSCAKDSSPEVILCLCCPDLLAPITCHDETTEVPYEFKTLPAVLVKSYKEGSSCGQSSYRYVFSYDEALLADPETALTSAQVSGVICKDCMTTWVAEEAGDECYIRDNEDGTITFVSQHGCEYTFSGALISGS
jgi:hypothetical protein